MLIFVTFCYLLLPSFGIFVNFYNIQLSGPNPFCQGGYKKVTKFVTISRIVGVDRHFVGRDILRLTINKEARYGRLRVIVRRGAHG